MQIQANEVLTSVTERKILQGSTSVHGICNMVSKINSRIGNDGISSI